MYERHDNIDTPPDDVMVWRYLNLEKLLALLATGRLYLCRLDRLRDPWEGAFPTRLIENLRRSLKSEQATAFLRAAAGLGTSLFVNCWHESSHESAALWNQYAQGAGLAIKSSIGGIKQAIIGGPNFHIGRVKYLDYESDDLRASSFNALVPPFLKRKSFEHEREVRILVWDPDKISPPECSTPLPEGIELPMNLQVLIETLYISPEAPRWLFDHIIKLLRRFDLSNLPVKRSTLYDRHVY